LGLPVNKVNVIATALGYWEVIVFRSGNELWEPPVKFLVAVWGMKGEGGISRAGMVNATEIELSHAMGLEIFWQV